LLDGRYEELDAGDPSCLAYLRETAGPPAETLLIVVNFSSRPQILSLPGLKDEGTILFSTDHTSSQGPFTPQRFRLGPEAGLLVRLTPR
jgi:hypothetical protein